MEVGRGGGGEGGERKRGREGYFCTTFSLIHSLTCVVWLQLKHSLSSPLFLHISLSQSSNTSAAVEQHRGGGWGQGEEDGGMEAGGGWRQGEEDGGMEAGGGWRQGEEDGGMEAGGGWRQGEEDGGRRRRRRRRMEAGAVSGRRE